MNRAKVVPYDRNLNRRQSVQEIQDGLDEMYKRQAIAARRNEMAMTEAMINEQRERAGLKPLPKKSFVDSTWFFFLVVVLFFSTLICAGNFLADWIVGWHPLQQLMGVF